MLQCIFAAVFALSCFSSFGFGYTIGRDMNRAGKVREKPEPQNIAEKTDEQKENEQKKAKLSKKYKDNFYSYDGTEQE